MMMILAGKPEGKRHSEDNIRWILGKQDGKVWTG
jgi:hypothetical protein